MNKMWLWFYLSCKRQLKRPFFLFLLFLLPIGLYGFKQMEKKDTDGIKIGIYMEPSQTEDREEETFFEEIMANLLTLDGAFAFYQCDSETELIEDVKARNAECGYVFNSGLLDQLQRGKYRNSIDLYIAPSTVAASLSTEVVFSSLFQVFGLNLLNSYWAESDIFREIGVEAASKEMASLYQKYSENGSTFSFVYETMGGDGATEIKPEEKGITAVFPVRGMVAVYMFVIGMFAAVMLCEDEKRGLFLPVSYSARIWCKLSYLAAPVFLAAVSGLLAIVLTGEAASREMFSLILYGLALTAFAYALKNIVRQSTVICSMIPFITIASLIFCPVFVDVSAFLPVVKVLRFCFLPYYYLQAGNLFP